MRRLTLVLILGLFGIGCVARSGADHATRASSYTVEISNEKNTAIMLSISDGGSERTLGSLGIGQAQRYLVNSVNDMVTVRARLPGGGVVYWADVKLANGRTPHLVIR